MHPLEPQQQAKTESDPVATTLTTLTLTYQLLRLACFALVLSLRETESWKLLKESKVAALALLHVAHNYIPVPRVVASKLQTTRQSDEVEHVYASPSEHHTDTHGLHRITQLTNST